MFLNEKIKIGIINTDLSKRYEIIKSAEEFKIGILETVCWMGSPSIMCFTEISNKAWINYYLLAMNHDSFLIKERDGCFMLTSWSKIKFECLKKFSCFSNRYMGLILKHRESKEIYLHITVHLPRRCKREAWNMHVCALRSSICEWAKLFQIDFITIAGDFNAKPLKIRQELMSIPQALFFAIPEDSCHKTTKAGNTIDNIISNKPFIEENVFIDTKNPRFSHFPIVASF